MPGHGVSSAYEEYPFILFIEAIKAGLEYYNFRDFKIIGHSMGGLLSVVCYSHELIEPYNPTVGISNEGI